MGEGNLPLITGTPRSYSKEIITILATKVIRKVGRAAQRLLGTGNCELAAGYNTLTAACMDFWSGLVQRGRKFCFVRKAPVKLAL